MARDSTHRYSQSKYRAEHRNVANATVSNNDDGSKAHVAYEDGNEDGLTRENLKEPLEAYGKELFKNIVN